MFFSRTSRPDSTKLGTSYLRVKGIQASSNEGVGPLQRGDNLQTEKMGRGPLKIFYSRTTGPSLTRLSTKHP
jgi:hypothetical protein